MTTAKDVFISYKAEEFEQADWVRTTLECRGIRCWMAPESIPGGTSYATEIPQAITSCKVFVLVLSRKAMASKWVPREVDQAINRNKVILPFMIEDCPLTDEFQFYLTNVQCYMAFRDRNDAINQMADQIHALLRRDKGADSEPSKPPAAQPVPPVTHPHPLAAQPKPQQPKVPRDSLCTAALICGIVSMILFLPSFAAVILAILGRKRIRTTNQEGKSFALAGLILGLFSMAILLNLIAPAMGSGIWVCILVAAIILYNKLGKQKPAK